MKHKKTGNFSRRNFLKHTSFAGAASLLPPLQRAENQPVAPLSALPPLPQPVPIGAPLNLEPAKWIWYPSARCLQNTFLLFRKEITLQTEPVKAEGSLLADSRYLIYINGKRVQWGPAPSDPRWT